MVLVFVSSGKQCGILWQRGPCLLILLHWGCRSLFPYCREDVWPCLRLHLFKSMAHWGVGPWKSHRDVEYGGCIVGLDSSSESSLISSCLCFPLVPLPLVPRLIVFGVFLPYFLRILFGSFFVLTTIFLVGWIGISWLLSSCQVVLARMGVEEIVIRHLIL